MHVYLPTDYTNAHAGRQAYSHTDCLDFISDNMYSFVQYGCKLKQLKRDEHEEIECSRQDQVLRPRSMPQYKVKGQISIYYTPLSLKHIFVQNKCIFK